MHVHTNRNYMFNKNITVTRVKEQNYLKIRAPRSKYLKGGEKGGGSITIFLKIYHYERH